MNKPTQAMIEADRIRAVIDDPSYQQTIGQWIDEEYASLPSQMAMEDDQIKNAKLRGQYQALHDIKERIRLVLESAERDARKLMEKK